jgi:hypothetical protein
MVMLRFLPGENEWRRDWGGCEPEGEEEAEGEGEEGEGKAEAKVWVNFACILLFESQSTIDGFPGPASSCVVDGT